MHKLISWFKMLPAIMEVVRNLEEAIPLPQQGKAKLDLLLDLVKVLYDSEESIRADFDWFKLASMVTSGAALVVAAFKKVGIFKGGQA